jgi:hypothetical protein
LPKYCLDIAWTLPGGCTAPQVPVEAPEHLSATPRQSEYQFRTIRVPFLYNCAGNIVLRNKALKQFNSYLEEVRGKLARHYRELQMKGERLTAAAVANKDAAT